MNEIYLVLEYEHRIIYIPFRKLEYVDEFTCGYDSPQALCKIINDYLELGIPEDEMLDAYLSENIYKINDDMQEFDKRYLAIQYTRDLYDYNDLQVKFGNFIRYNSAKTYAFSGLDKVITNYRNKYRDGKALLDKDPDKISQAYLGTDYKRKKECYFKLKDMGYHVKINKPYIDPTKTSIAVAEEDKHLFCWLIDMTLDDLKEYVAKQENKGMKR